MHRNAQPQPHRNNCNDYRQCNRSQTLGHHDRTNSSLRGILHRRHEASQHEISRNKHGT
jgi:hypothetical protein